MSQFQNANAYERYMSGWSRAAGTQFLDWLALPPGLRWLNVGCGSGAFTALLAERAAPTELHGLDCSPDMLAYAQSRLPAHVQLYTGDATALPFPAACFDAAVMPLVIVFLDDAARAVAEMRRVVRAGGMVATYIWDLPQGFPYYTAFAILREIGVLPDRAAPDESTALPQLQALWQNAGLQAVTTAAFAVHQRYPDFAAYWQALQTAPASARASPHFPMPPGTTCATRCAAACPPPPTAASPSTPAPMRCAALTGNPTASHELPHPPPH